jgi:hypothetical protein
MRCNHGTNVFKSQLPQNPDPQKDGVSGDDITHPQERQPLPDRLPQGLVEWLARINRRYLALNQEKTNDTRNQFVGCVADASKVVYSYLTILSTVFSVLWDLKNSALPPRNPCPIFLHACCDPLPACLSFLHKSSVFSGRSVVKKTGMKITIDIRNAAMN